MKTILRKEPTRSKRKTPQSLVHKIKNRIKAREAVVEKLFLSYIMKQSTIKLDYSEIILSLDI